MFNDIYKSLYNPLIIIFPSDEPVIKQSPEIEGDDIPVWTKMQHLEAGLNN